MTNRARVIALLGFVVLGLTAACGEDGIDSNEAARRCYLGLDPSIPQSLQLGFDGFNTAPTGANISPQTGTGAGTGSLTISGQVDQGSSDNKGMRLYVGMVDYSAGPFTVVVNEDEEVEVNLTYATSAVQIEQPYLHLSLRNIPSGTFTGELTGVYHVRGDIEADVTLDLMMSGNLRDAGGGVVDRVPGSTTITGTASSGDGLFDVSLTL